VNEPPEPAAPVVPFRRDADSPGPSGPSDLPDAPRGEATTSAARRPARLADPPRDLSTALVRVAPPTNPEPDLDQPPPPPDDSALRLGDVDAWGRSEHIREIARTLYDPLYRRWFRAEWEGLEHIPREGGALLVANHAGAIPSDAPVIMHGIETELRRPVYGLAEFLLRSLPYVGTLWSRAGGVAAHPENAYRLLRDDQQLALVFPEGTKGTSKHYRDRYKLHRFGRGGFVEIAMRSGVPVVPIAVVGAEESMPIVWKSARLARMLGMPYVPVTANMIALGPVLGLVGYFPAKFKLRVLPPVHFGTEANAERYSRSRVMEESELIREQIQDALYDMLRTRRSVWFG